MSKRTHDARLATFPARRAARREKLAEAEAVRASVNAAYHEHMIRRHSPERTKFDTGSVLRERAATRAPFIHAKRNRRRALANASRRRNRA